MHHLDKLVYLMCVFILVTLGISSVNNLKKDLLNQSNTVNEAVTAYSKYLQTKNF